MKLTTLLYSVLLLALFSCSENPTQSLMAPEESGVSSDPAGGILSKSINTKLDFEDFIKYVIKGKDYPAYKLLKEFQKKYFINTLDSRYYLTYDPEAPPKGNVYLYFNPKTKLIIDEPKKEKELIKTGIGVTFAEPVYFKSVYAKKFKDLIIKEIEPIIKEKIEEPEKPQPKTELLFWIEGYSKDKKIYTSEVFVLGDDWEKFLPKFDGPVYRVVFQAKYTGKYSKIAPYFALDDFKYKDKD